MKEYLLVYHADYKAMPKRSPEEMQANLQSWMNWIAGIAAQNKLSSKGNRLEPSGKLLTADEVVTDGPYTEIKESIMGYSMVKADSYEDATALARGCPILKFGGKVEIREISVL